tara:strand:- start:890 stop:2284 length:1395 start_codon:yes stop_codon:yes gene_type:complete
MEDRLRLVSRFRLANRGDIEHDISSFKLAVAEASGGPWTELGSFSALAGTSDFQEFAGWVPRTASYWRLSVLATHGGGFPQLSEVQFQGEVRGGRVKWGGGESWILSMVPTPSPGSDAASLLFDGDVSTYWDAGNASYPYQIIFDLGDADRILVLDTCGLQASLDSFPLPRFPREGLRYEYAGKTIGFGSVPMTAAGGLYRLCWCPSSLMCSMPEHFLLDTGSLTIVGPSPLYQAQTCVSGQTCQVQLSGHLLQEADTLLLLDTCGGPEVEDANDQLWWSLPDRHENNAAGRLRLASSGAFVTWGNTPVTAYGGQYRLCWCAGSFWNINGTFEKFTLEYPSSYRCSEAEHFRVDAGHLTVIGPSAREFAFIGHDLITGQFDDRGLGIACQDAADGEGFIMYSFQPLRKRGFDVLPGNADHFVCVKKRRDSWVYDTNAMYVRFDPVQSDVLVASVDFASGAVTNQ